MRYHSDNTYLNAVWELVRHIGIFYVYRVKVIQYPDIIEDGFEKQIEILCKYLTIFGRRVIRLSKTEKPAGDCSLYLKSHNDFVNHCKGEGFYVGHIMN